MSMINNAHPGSSLSLLILIDRALCRRAGKPVPREDLILRFRPENLPPKKQAKPGVGDEEGESGEEEGGAARRFEENLAFWIDEGLWNEDEKGVTVPGPEPNEANLPFRVLDRLFQRTEIREGASVRGNNRVDPFLQVMACLLAQNRHAAILDPRPLVAQESREEPSAVRVADSNNLYFPEERINSSNASAPLLAYGQYLGFMEPYGEKAEVVDPARAMGWFLDSVFGSDKELPAKEFVRRLGLRIPILDAGQIRSIVEKQMASKGWTPPGANRLSASLSLGIYRLRQGLHISLHAQSDDPDSLELDLQNRTMAFSYVKKEGTCQ